MTDTTNDLTRQDMKADARKSADMAPPADPEVGAQAIADAKGKGAAANGETRQQPVYKTQTEDIAGDNVHRGKDAVISEFDDPAAKMV